MARSDVVQTTKKTVTSVRDYVAAQADHQLASFADRIHGTEATLRSVTNDLQSDEILSFAAPFLEQAAKALGDASTYLQTTKTGEVASDLEAFGRKQPLVATLVAAAAGFAVSRALKASSSRRFHGTASLTVVK